MSDRQVNLDELRRRAQRAIELGISTAQARSAAPSPIEVTQLIEELRIYQTELEIQNQELNEAHAANVVALQKYRALYDQLPLPAILTDVRGFIVEANAVATAFLNLSRISALRRTSALQFFDIDGRAELFPLLQNRTQTDSGKLNQLQVRVGQGATTPCDVYVIHLPGDHDQEAHTLLVLVDQSQELALRESEHNFRSLADSSMTLIWATGPDLNWTYTNQSWRDFSGDTEIGAAHAGWLARLHPEDRERCQTLMNGRLERLESYSLDYRLRRHDGVYRWIRDTGAPRHDSRGRFLGFIDHGLDITDLVETERNLRQSEQRYRELNGTLEAQVEARTAALHESEAKLNHAQQVAEIGSWHFDLVNDVLTWSEQTHRLFQFPQSETPSFAAFMAMVHPDDRETLLKTWQAALAGAPFDLEHRILVDGKIRWVRERAEVRFDASGKPLLATGTGQDITLRKEAELALRANRFLLDNLISNSPSPIFAMDRQHRFNLTNASHLGFWKLAENQLLGRTETEAFPRETARMLWQDNEQLMRTGEPLQREEELLLADGSRRVVLVTKFPLRDEQDRIVGLGGLATDITDRKRAERELRASEERLRLALEATRLGTFDWNLDTGRLLWTRRHEELWGYGPGEFGENFDGFADRVHPEDLPGVQAELDRCIAERVRFERDFRIVWPDGSVHWIASAAECFCGDDGRPLRLLGTALDITDSQALKAELRKLSLAVEQANESIAITNLDARLEYVNAAFINASGYQREEVIGQNPRVLHSGKTPQATYQALWQSLSQGESWQGEFINRRKDGSEYIEAATISPLRQEDGRITHYVAAKRDITAIKANESELLASEARFRAIFEEAPLGVALIDSLNGHIHEVNPRFAQIAGRSHEEMTRIDWMSITHRDDVQEDLDNMARMNAGEIPGFQMNKRYLRPDGSVVWISMTIAPLSVPHGDRPRHLCMIEDITARKQVEAQLLERVALREQLGSIAQSVPGMVYSFRLRPDGTNCLPYTSPRVGDIFGLAPEVLAEDAQPLFDLILPEDIGSIQEGIAESARTLGPFRAEWRYRHPERGVRWLEATSNPVQEADGAILWHGFVHDVTDRKRAEEDLESARRKALAASQAKSEFLANMSHEIRTPMNAILGLTQILERESRDAEARDLLHKISDAGGSLLRIINDILDFSKIEAGQVQIDPHPFELAPLLARLDTLLGPAARQRGIGLTIHAAAAVDGALLGDSLRIEQILTNLLGNALKFTQTGAVTLSITPLAVGERAVRLRFEVTDTGIGVPPEALGTLFQPFTQAEAGTTRRFGGTGLGLSISKRLVELMGGEIGVTSAPGQGSTFWFELPLPRATTTNPATPAVVTASPPPKGPRLQGLRVLAVDDNRLNLFMLERALKLEGASVCMAADGQQALQTLQAAPREFDVVLMDIQMPVMDGLTATRHIREDRALAALPIVALTAGVLAEEREAALAAGVNDFLPKPLELARMVAALTPYTRAPSADGVN